MKVYQLNYNESNETYHRCLHKSKPAAMTCLEREVATLKEEIDDDEFKFPEINYEDSSFEDEYIGILVWIEELELEE